MPSMPIDPFAVVCLVAWPLNESEAGIDLVLIEASMLFLCKFNLHQKCVLLHDERSNVFGPTFPENGTYGFKKFDGRIKRQIFATIFPRFRAIFPRHQLPQKSTVSAFNQYQADNKTPPFWYVAYNLTIIQLPTYWFLV